MSTFSSTISSTSAIKWIQEDIDWVIEIEEVRIFSIIIASIKLITVEFWVTWWKDPSGEVFIIKIFLVLNIEEIEWISLIVLGVLDQTIFIVNLQSSSIVRNDDTILRIFKSMAFKTFVVCVINSSTINVSATLLPPFIRPVGRIFMNIGHFSLLIFEQDLDVSLTFNTFVQRSILDKSIIVVIDEWVSTNRASKIEFITLLTKTISIDDLIWLTVCGLIRE